MSGSGSGDAASDLACLVALASLPGIGPATLLGLHRSIGGAEAWRLVVGGGTDHHPLLAAAAERLARADASARRSGPHGGARLAAVARALVPGAVLERHRAGGIEVLVEGAPGFPARLADDPAPPAVLFVRGDPTLLDEPAVAIVGTRNATRLGCDTAAGLARALAEVGVGVVSGLALGIDGAAHRPLVERRTNGAPIGVVATGLDRTYPKRHATLHAQVASRGALVSEVPLGGGPTSWRFPARNRIIAALGLALVIVESRSAGGSMLTAAEALARDRPVLAVPGHPTSPASAGPLDLLADGAIPVRDAEDVLVAIGRGGCAPRPGPQRPSGPSAPEERLDDRCRSVLDALRGAPASFGELARRTREPIEHLALALAELEAAGMVARRGLWFEVTTAGARSGGAR